MTQKPLHPELGAVDVQATTRSDFLAKGLLAAGAVYGVGAVGPFMKQAFAQGGKGDIDILNFALTLEYLEATFYERAIKEVDLGSGIKKFATVIRDDEAAHVDALLETIKSLGGKPVKAPKVEFPFSDQKSFLELAQTLEDTGVSAYNGAAPLIKSTEVLAAAGSIVQIEARHAARVRIANNADPAPQSFDSSLEMAQVLDAVKPFVVG